MQEQNNAVTTDQAGEQPQKLRRLVDKISAAAQHALNQGRREFAAKLKLLHQAVVEKEIEEGHADRLEDDLNDWLETRANSARGRRKARQARY